MKHLIKFNNYVKEGFEPDNARSLKIGDVISYIDLGNYISSLNDDELNDFFLEKINKFSKYQLVELDINDIDIISDLEISKSLVDEYKIQYEDSGWYPPIFFDIEDGIIDGYHRAKMIMDSSEQKIKAFVGI